MPLNAVSFTVPSPLQPQDAGAGAAPLLENVPFPVVLVDRQGAISHFNTAFSTAWGEPPTGRLAELVHPDDRQQLLTALAAAEPARSTTATLRMTAPHDQPLWARATISVHGATAGAEAILAVTLTDITDLKLEMAELSMWESRWNKALVSSATGVWDHDWARGNKYYSPTWRRIRGMTDDDPLPASTEAWLDLLHPDDREHVIHCASRQNAGDPAYSVFEYRERHKDGHWIWIECRGDCIEWDENGKPTRIMGTDTDITARKEAEEAATRLSRRLDMALEISGIGVYECDLTTGVVDWDERMFRIYGLDRRQDIRVGGLWETLLHPEDAGRVVDKVDRNLSDGSRFSDQFRVRLNDGSERIIRARTMTFLEANGHTMTVGANWDVTEDAQLHRELERAKTLAEARNIELELAKEQIEHSAMHDYLTELPNRRYLDEMLDRMSAECRRSGAGIAILHVDLDRFKQVNDTLGHHAGDAILIQSAQTLRDTLRPDDFIARIGGDEFVVVSRLEDTREPVTSVATRMIEALCRPVTYEGHHCQVGASIGIAGDTGPNIDIRQLMRNSDIALYEAKQLGRSRFVVYSAADG